MTEIETDDGVLTSWTWDGPLILSEVSDGPVTEGASWTWNRDLNVATETVAGGDAADDGDTVVYGYDEDGLVTRAGSLDLARDPETGQVTDITLGDISDRITWNGYGEPEAYQAQHAGSFFWSWDVDRDVLGRIVDRTETGSDGVTHRVRYVYDVADRLSEVWEDGVETWSFTYDPNGNRTTPKAPPGASRPPTTLRTG